MSWKVRLQIVVGILVWIPFILIQASPIPQWILWLLGWVIPPLHFLPTWAYFVPGLIPLGLVMVPIALWKYGAHSGKWPKLFFIWGNDDSPPPEWWYREAFMRRMGKMAERFPNFWWFAMRNPACNTHWWFPDREPKYYGSWPYKKMEAKDLLEQKQPDAKRWACSGVLVGYRHVWLDDDAYIDENGKAVGHYNERWFAFKLGSDTPGLGFAMQNRLHVEIGK